MSNNCYQIYKIKRLNPFDEGRYYPLLSKDIPITHENSFITNGKIMVGSNQVIKDIDKNKLRLSLNALNPPNKFIIQFVKIDDGYFINGGFEQPSSLFVKKPVTVGATPRQFKKHITLLKMLFGHPIHCNKVTFHTVCIHRNRPRNTLKYESALQCNNPILTLEEYSKKLKESTIGIYFSK